MAQRESTIRDNLAKSLHLIEPGLTLIQKEYPLPNPFGSKGYIDILARDSFGNRVIIELKRTDQAARQAIHEIFKYVALFRESNRIPENRLRCLIVSTEWRELRVPFSELRRSSRFQVEGFLIDVDSSGCVKSATRQEPLELADNLQVFRSHAIFLFEKAPSRDAAITPLEAAIMLAGGTGGFIVSQDYIGPNAAVIYRYAAYLVPAEIPAAIRAELERSFESDGGNRNELTKEEWELGIQEEFMARVTREFALHDSFEIGYPEKFLTNLESEWIVPSIRRVGNVLSEAAASDAEIITLIKGMDGQNLIQFRKITSPRLHLDWEATQEMLVNSLRGNSSWLAACHWFSGEVQRTMPEASVSYSIYNPLNIVVSLFKLVGRNDSRFIPQMEVIATDPAKDRVVFLLGRLEWDGRTIVHSVDAALGPEIGGLAEFFFMNSVHVAWEQDDDLLHRHGLSYGTVNGEAFQGSVSYTPVRCIDTGAQINVEEVELGRNLAEFCSANEAYLRELIESVPKISAGL